MLYVLNEYDNGTVMVYDDKGKEKIRYRYEKIYYCDNIDIVTKEDVLNMAKITEIKGVVNGKIVDWVKPLLAKKKLLGVDGYSILDRIDKIFTVKDDYLYVSRYILQSEIFEIFKGVESAKFNFDYLKFDKTDNISMLFGYMNLQDVNLLSLDTTNCTMMHSTFTYCGFKSISFGKKFTTANVMSMKCMFRGTALKSELRLDTFSSEKLIDASEMFKDSEIDKIKFGDRLTLSNVQSIAEMFSGSEIDIVDFNNIELRGTVNAESIFSGSAIGLLDLSKANFDGLESINLRNAFRGIRNTLYEIRINKKALDKLKMCISGDLGISYHYLQSVIKIV